MLPTKTTHVHLVRQNETGPPELYEVEVITAFHLSVAIEFKNRSMLVRILDELPTSAVPFDYDRVANVVAENFDGNAHETIHTLGSGPIDDGCAVHESLKRFFINKGYVAKSNVVFKGRPWGHEDFCRGTLQTRVYIYAKVERGLRPLLRSPRARYFHGDVQHPPT